MRDEIKELVKWMEVEYHSGQFASLFHEEQPPESKAEFVDQM
jgi:hypothetical protein